MKKSQKKARNYTEHPIRPITIQILQCQKRRKGKQNNGKINKIEEKMLKTKYSDKGAALFGSVKNLIKATNLSQKYFKHFLHAELVHEISNCYPKNAANQGTKLRYRRNLVIRSGLC